MSQPLTKLAPLRHTCLGCGTCCHGHWIPMVDADEIARIERHGASLGVERPLVDGALRQEAGACVFLDADNRCRIHSQMGGTEKPLRCQLWPLKVVRTEGELRIGVDPGCSSSWRTFADGPELEAERLIVREEALTGPERRLELALLQAARAPDATLGRLAGFISGAPDHVGPELPAGMASRLLTRLQASRLAQFLELPDLGEALVEPMRPVAAAIASLDPTEPPPLDLAPDAQAFALDVLSRRLYLREAPMAPAVHGLVLVMLAGIAACAWTDPSLEVFGPRLSRWSRLAGQRALWLRLAPEPEHLRWMATGGYDGTLGTGVVIGGRGAPEA